MAASLPLTPPAAAFAEEAAPSRNTVWRRFRRHRVAMAGAVVMILVGLTAALAN
ncbi:MAG: ABC transporter permease, partial [Candidatus Eremiobacteraeota bacterium]|nr:ABC transporter permease [Candidatus Eremiobacteraeota bacterium]